MVVVVVGAGADDVVADGLVADNADNADMEEEAASNCCAWGGGGGGGCNAIELEAGAGAGAED